MELKGKKANFLGDSVTEGAACGKEEDIYFNVLKRETGLIEARGYGLGGTRISRQTLPSKDPQYDHDFLERVPAMEEDADVVVVFGGTNDFDSGDAPLGVMSDRSPYTFYGALHALSRALIERYPQAEIVMMTPLHREIEERGERRLRDFVEAIREVSEYYAFPVVDLYAASGIQPQVKTKKERYCPDGLHPNEKGHQVIASRLQGLLNSL